MRPFEALVAEHGAVVMRVCRAVVAGPDADDAWSETFLAALRAYPQLREDSNVRGWLVTIAHRKAIDVLRRRQRTPIPVESIGELATAAAVTPAPFDERLRHAIAELPSKQRRAVVYHYVADLPYAAVGELIGSSEAAARRSAADGIAALRTLVDKEDHR